MLEAQAKPRHLSLSTNQASTPSVFECFPSVYTKNKDLRERKLGAEGRGGEGTFPL